MIDRCFRLLISRALLALFGASLLLVAQTPAAHAQSDWPARPIRIVVPFAPGGTTDITARIVAEQLTSVLKQTVVVENKAGAGGNVGAAEVARAAPDGYTFLMGTPGTQAINQFLYPKMPYDTAKDLIPVSFTARVPNVLMVHPSVPANTIQELIALARAKPGALTYGSPGNGATGHLSTELFKTRAKVFITHIPYRGSSPMLQDLMAGQIQMSIDNLPSALPYIKAGKLRALGVTSSARSEQLPDVPSVASVPALALSDLTSGMSDRAASRGIRPVSSDSCLSFSCLKLTAAELEGSTFTAREICALASR